MAPRNGSCCASLSCSNGGCVSTRVVILGARAQRRNESVERAARRQISERRQLPASAPLLRRYALTYSSEASEWLQRGAPRGAGCVRKGRCPLRRSSRPTRRSQAHGSGRRDVHREHRRRRANTFPVALSPFSLLPCLHKICCLQHSPCRPCGRPVLPVQDATAAVES